MMSTIYRKASRVIAWLGMPLDGTEEGFKVIRRCAHPSIDGFLEAYDKYRSLHLEIRDHTAADMNDLLLNLRSDYSSDYSWTDEERELFTEEFKLLY